MRAFKFLSEGARGRFSGYVWPVPDAVGPGVWVTTQEPLLPCTRGIHGCRAQDLAYWLDDELWELELDGTVVRTDTMVVAPRGRLIARVSAWDARLQDAFGQHCLDRARSFAHATNDEAHAAQADDLTQQVARLLARGALSTAAYVSAFASQLAVGQSASTAFASERAAQSAWLAERLA